MMCEYDDIAMTHNNVGLAQAVDTGSEFIAEIVGQYDQGP